MTDRSVANATVSARPLWSGFVLRSLAAVVVVCAFLSQATAEEAPQERSTNAAAEAADTAPLSASPAAAPQASPVAGLLRGGPEKWTSPEGLQSSLQTLALLTVVSVAPAILLMTTCFVRIVVVLGLLRQAIGTPQLPPSQVTTALALFLSLAIMSPVFNEVYREGVVPYTSKQKALGQAWEDGVRPVRRFMTAQIEATGNRDDVWLFLRYAPQSREPETYDDVPLSVLLPAFMLSELKTAFLIGFQLYLPFLIIDLVVSGVTMSMGMMMLPPSVVSLPLKLLLFVLVDGWHLVVGMLLESFAPL